MARIRLGDLVFGRLVAVLLVVSLLAVAPAVAGAARGGGTVTVPAGTVHEGNLEVVAGTVVIDGTVDGDVQGVAGSIVVSGTVTGNVEAAAGSVTIRGTVEGNVESAGGSVSLLEGGRVGGSLEAGAGTLTLSGVVDGDVRAGVERLTVEETATIGGDLVYDATTAEISSGATVGGEVRQVDSLDVGVGLPLVGDVPFGAVFATWTFALFGFVLNLAVGALLLVAGPRFARRVVATGESTPLRSGVAGLLVFVGVPVILVVLLLTLVGIPLAVAGLFAYLLVLWVAYVYGALVAGTWLASLADVDSLWAGLVVGLLVAAVLSVVSLGGVVSFVYLLLGLGALALSALAVRRGEGGGEDVEVADRGESTGGTEPA